MKKITACIVSIGDEVLLGDTLDTNAHFIARELRKINIELEEIRVIHDDEDTIEKVLDDCSQKADVVISTGGLGPTRDDKTKYVLSRLVKSELEINAQAMQWVTHFYEEVLGRKMNELNKNQALLPKVSIPLQNKTGTACGIWTKHRESILINLPGVPNEMRYLIKNEVIPRLKESFETSFTCFRYIKTKGIPESVLAESLTEVEDTLPKHIQLAYLPTNTRVKLRFTAKGDDKRVLEKELIYWTEKAQEIIPSEAIYSTENERVLDRIQQLCLAKKVQLATAESFTSGAVASQITSISGSSTYFKGGIVSYSPEIKISLLKVNETLIKEKGTVDEEVAIQMAKGALSQLNSDVAISTTGMAGPTTDEYSTEIGTAWIAIAHKNKVKTYRFHYPHLSREDFTSKMVDIALEKLMTFLQAM